MRYSSMRLKAAASMLCVIGVMAALLVVASGAQAAPNKTTLSFMGSAEQQTGWDAVIEGFNRTYAKSNVSVEPRYVPGTSFGPLLATQIQSGNEPDLYTINSGAGSAYGVWRLAGQGKLLDLSRSSWAKGKDVPKSARDLARYKGHTYAYQVSYSPLGLLYNQSLFKSMKLKAPTTFAQLLGMCRKIAGTGKIPIAFGGLGFNASITLTASQAANNVYSVTPNWSLQREQGKVKFANSPLWRRALQGIVDMNKAKCFPPSPAAITVPQQYAMMASGEAVMMVGAGTEAHNVNLINPKVKIGLFAHPAPKAANTRAVVATISSALVAKAKTSHAFAAKQFINYVARPDVSRRINKLNGNVAGIDMVRGVVPSYASSMKPLFKAGKVQLAFNYYFGNPSKGLFIPGLIGKIPGLFTGQQTVQGILDYLDTTWDSK